MLSNENFNPCKRARYIVDESMDSSEGTLSLPDLQSQMTEFVHHAVENFTENNPRVCDEMAMIRFQQQQKHFVEQSISFYLDVLKPLIPNHTFADLAKKHAMSIYETEVQSNGPNVMMNNEHQSTINNLCPYSPGTTSSSSFSEKSSDSYANSVHFESIDTPVESQNVVTPVVSPLSLKSHAYLVNGIECMPFVPEDAEVASVMDMGGYYDKLSVRNGHSPFTSIPSPFSLLAGSVDCTAVVSA